MACFSFQGELSTGSSWHGCRLFWGQQESLSHSSAKTESYTHNVMAGVMSITFAVFYSLEATTGPTCAQMEGVMLRCGPPEDLPARVLSWWQGWHLVLCQPGGSRGQKAAVMEWPSLCWSPVRVVMDTHRGAWSVPPGLCPAPLSCLRPAEARAAQSWWPWSPSSQLPCLAESLGFKHWLVSDSGSTTRPPFPQLLTLWWF